jgi:hypothetical protein
MLVITCLDARVDPAHILGDVTTGLLETVVPAGAGS